MDRLSKILDGMRIEVGGERKLEVYRSLSTGSDPRGSFFLLVALSALIAAFGLVMNSAAVIIGAMLVAPLMTPILGLGLSLVRGDTRLFKLALRSEVAGVAIVIVASAMLGTALPYFDVTPEMLSRTHPNLFDFLVAVFAGLAGAYALVDEKLSPVLPGVAISTAIVPPLANTGLSLSLGAFEGAWGSFLLFFTNFLCILLVSSAVFFLAGMAKAIQNRKGAVIVRRFGVAFAGFIIIGVFLGGELIAMLGQQRLANDLREALKVELAEFAISDMERLLLKDERERILVLADINAPRELKPSQIGQVQERLSIVAGKPVQLYLRTSITHDVSAVGAVSQSVVESLDGFFSPAGASGLVKEMQVAEQVIREYLEGTMGINLQQLESSVVRDYHVIAATLEGTRQLDKGEVEEIETRIRARLENPAIWLVANQRKLQFTDRLGGGTPGLFSAQHMDLERQKIAVQQLRVAESWLEQHSFWLEAWYADIINDEYVLLFEVKGPQEFSEQHLEDLRGVLAMESDRPIQVYVRAHIEAVLGTDDNISYEELLLRLRERSKL
jgi:uncharacterized hydrophobic protein (TIGR00271 family)